MTVRAEVRYRLFHDVRTAEPLTSTEDVDALIDALLAGPANENLAQVHSLERSPMPSGYPDHELLVGVDSSRGVGLLTFMDATGNWVTVGEPTDEEWVVYFIATHYTELPGSSEIAVDLVRQAAREFVMSGGQRPTCVEWQAYS
jgi:hypothetical protein